MVDVGQVFTPATIAAQMAEWLLEEDYAGAFDILDPGAGSGQLSESVKEALQSKGLLARARFTLVEVDPLLAEDAHSMLKGTDNVVISGDFIELATGCSSLETYSHVIANPPYARLRRNSHQGKTLVDAGRYVSNLYAAFLWLAADRVEQGGRMVAIVPRSFFNGQLFKAMRSALFTDFQIRRIHTFPDRTSAFSRDRVLQETVIVVLDRKQPDYGAEVVISGGHFWEGCTKRQDYTEYVVAYPMVLDPSDPDRVIRIPSPRPPGSDLSESLLISSPYSVSTGKVVAHRRRDVIGRSSAGNVVPFINTKSLSPDGLKIQSYLSVSGRTEPLVLPPGIYVVVNRFSPTERRPRLRVSLVECVGEHFSRGVAFDNHLNVIVKDGKGLTKPEALRLCESLNHPAVEWQFIQMSGSTQVNASDLRKLKTPAPAGGKEECSVDELRNRNGQKAHPAVDHMASQP